VTWPCDQDLIFSGEARLMRIASKSGVNVLSPEYLYTASLHSVEFRVHALACLPGEGRHAKA